MPRFQYTGLELISQFILSERLGPSPLSDSDKLFLDRYIDFCIWLMVIFILDRINKIYWIYCFFAFRMKTKNNNPAKAGK